MRIWKGISRAVLFAACAWFIMMGLDGNMALAASSESIVSGGTGLGGNFDKQLEVIGSTFVTLAKVTVMIMTAVAAMMVGMGMEDHKKTVWNWLLGAGLAVNFGLFLDSVGLLDSVPSGGFGSAVTFYTPEIKEHAVDSNPLTDFMNSYMTNVINPGSKAILSPCCKLLIILAVIEASWEMSFKLISGDKVKYLLTMLIKAGFFLFLMMNWISLSEALGQGFQQIGFTAGGVLDPNAPNLTPDSIWHNGSKILDTFWKDANFSLSAIGLTLVNIIGGICILVCTLLTAIEMFAARIEYYTMALICLPLVPFLMTNKFSFLGEKAIGAMFNLAIKLSVISFMTAMFGPMLEDFATKVAATADASKQIGLLIQCVLTALVIVYLIRKIPNLVTGLLNGQPQLGGSGMKDMMASAASKPVAVAGGIKAAHAMAKAKGGGGALSTLKQLGANQFARNSVTQAYRGGMQNFENRANNTSSRISDRISRLGSGKSAPDGGSSQSSHGAGAPKGRRRALKSAKKFVRRKKLPGS